MVLVFSLLATKSCCCMYLAGGNISVQHSCIAIQAHNVELSHTPDILRGYVIETNITKVLCQIYRGREQTVYT